MSWGAAIALAVAAAAGGAYIAHRRRGPCCAACAGDAHDDELELADDDGPESDGFGQTFGSIADRGLLFIRDAFDGSSSSSRAVDCAACLE